MTVNRRQLESQIRNWRDEMDDAGKTKEAMRLERQVATQCRIPDDAIRSQILLRMITDEALQNVVKQLGLNNDCHGAKTDL